MKIKTGPEPRGSLKLSLAEGVKLQSLELRSKEVNTSIPVRLSDNQIRVDLEVVAWTEPQEIETVLVARVQSLRGESHSEQLTAVDLPLTIKVVPPVRVVPSRIRLIPEESPVEIVVQSDEGFEIIDATFAPLPEGWGIEKLNEVSFQAVCHKAIAGDATPLVSMRVLRSTSWESSVTVLHRTAGELNYVIPATVLVLLEQASGDNVGEDTLSAL